MTWTAERAREYQREYRQRRRQTAIEYLGGRCVQCGATEQLEFDHIDPTEKVTEVRQLIVQRPWEETVVELDKCQLLCHTCHKVKTNSTRRKRVPHGGGRNGQKGCTCQPCRDVRALRQREWRARKAT